MEQFINKSNSIHNNKYDYTNVIYINGKTKVKIMCKTHGEFEQTPIRHYKSGCQKCKPKRIYKHSTETFIQKSKDIHNNKYDYSNVNYIDNKTKVKIICKIHGEFELRPDDHFQNVGCVNCSTKNINNNKINFLEQANNIHQKLYDYSKVNYINGHTNVIIICPIHGEFEQLPSNHLRGSICKLCSTNFITINKRHGNDKKFIDKANEVHNNKYDYSKSIYINKNEPIIIKCNIHGDFTQKPKNHLHSKGCYNCTIENMVNNIKEVYSVKFIELSNEVHNNKYNYTKTKYENTNTKVIITCQKHGEFLQLPSSHLSGNGCNKCRKAGYSKKQIEWLEYLMKTENIFIKHALNGGEITIDKYKIDGFCKETNTCFEFNGSYFHGDPRLYNDDFINTLKNKTMKELYDETIKKENNLKLKNYNLVVMWELDWDKFKNDNKL